MNALNDMEMAKVAGGTRWCPVSPDDGAAAKDEDSHEEGGAEGTW